MISILVGVLLTTIAAVLFTRTVVAPIRHLTNVTSRIVREGDLKQHIEVRSADEVGQLAASFAQLVEKLREIPNTLNESVGSLTHASDALADAAAEQSDVVLRQSAALQETQVTAQELKQTSLLAAQKAEDVLSVVQRADDVGREGERAVEESLRTLADMNASIVEIAQRVQQLDHSARQIGDITASVKDLADQSNMLALNAAIEAVRSGEHGKGFGVVAREIRSLADQSIDATKRVREILQAVTEAISGLVRIAERGSQQMEGGLAQMRSSGDKLTQLAAIVKENSNAARQIAGAVRQQSAAMAQIFSAVSSQMQMMDDTKRRIEGTTSAAEQLRTISARISDIVRSYRA
jgi:methyl-accepting chemotaxis protein